MINDHFPCMRITVVSLYVCGHIFSVGSVDALLWTHTRAGGISLKLRWNSTNYRKVSAYWIGLQVLERWRNVCWVTHLQLMYPHSPARLFHIMQKIYLLCHSAKCSLLCHWSFPIIPFYTLNKNIIFIQHYNTLTLLWYWSIKLWTIQYIVFFQQSFGFFSTIAATA